MNKKDLMEQSMLTLEYHQILNRMAALAIAEETKEKIYNLRPFDSYERGKEKLQETTEARKLLEDFGTPPLAMMKEMAQYLTICEAGGMLIEEQLEELVQFLSSVKRMRSYLKRAEQSGIRIAYYGRSFEDTSVLYEEITKAIFAHQVVDEASSELKSVRRKLEGLQSKIKEKLEQLVRSKKSYLADQYIVERNGRWVLPVKKAYKAQIPGTVVDTSGSGNTLFIEPFSASKLQEELSLLQIREQNEVYRILYELTGLVEQHADALRRNMETMLALDFVFAKGKLSMDMKANEVMLNDQGILRLTHATHPLLNVENLVPLDFSLGEDTRGIVITGPNTGGKTVALKTVGLLSMMARSGLHISADRESTICMNDSVLCDIGDGQSITQNLSTFSSHIKNMTQIIEAMTSNSLILLDECGSGTDPQEGMGIAIAILEALRRRGCLFVVTTHYPEVKEYARRAEGLINARMAFDKETLSPLYRLEIGEAGESNAFYIAKRLGFPSELLAIANKAAYPEKGRTASESSTDYAAIFGDNIPPKIVTKKKKTKNSTIVEYAIGDSVMVSPSNEIGIVYALANEMGEVGVQIKGKKARISHKRLRLHVSASELYPEDYDFSIIFDSVENRKLRHKMSKHHVEGEVLPIIKE